MITTDIRLRGINTIENKIKWKEIASIYIGTVIGAGFASGKEILQFFGDYGSKGILGIVLSSILFAIIAAVILLKVYTGKYQSYQDIIFPVLGKKLGVIIELFMLSYLFMSFCIMLAGSGTLFKNQLNMSYDIGLAVMAILALITMMYSVRGISIVNTILIPFLIIVIVIIGLLVVNVEGVNTTYIGPNKPFKYNWLISSILYVSYNILSAVAVLSSLLPIIKNKRSAIAGGVMGGLGLGLLSLFILLPLLILYKDVYQIEIPMIKAASYIGSGGEVIYSVILWIAMFTTAVGNGFGLVSRISVVTKMNFKIVAVILCATTVPFARIGFSNLVNTFYPIFGYIGALFLFLFVFISIYKKIFIRNSR